MTNPQTKAKKWAKKTIKVIGDNSGLGANVRRFCELSFVAGYTQAIKDASDSIDKSVKAVPNPLRESFTIDDMVAIRQMCKEMWLIDIQGLVK